MKKLENNNPSHDKFLYYLPLIYIPYDFSPSSGISSSVVINFGLGN